MKISIDDAVPVPMGTQANNKSVVAVDKTERLLELDHALLVGIIIDYIMIYYNVSEVVPGSFFTSGDDGICQIVISFKDAFLIPQKHLNMLSN